MGRFDSVGRKLLPGHDAAAALLASSFTCTGP